MERKGALLVMPGGVIVPVSRLELLAPWLGLAFAVAGGLGALSVTRARRREGG